MDSVDIKFIADAMLGTLAKWLRIMGYDTLFDADLNDHHLARLARAENRVLLTRDRELARRRGLRAILIAGETLDDQIHQVLSELSLLPDRSFSRCPVCNAPLEPVDRQAVQGQVPTYVARTHDRFSYCPDCQRIYWRGTHWQQMETHLARIYSSDTRPDPAAEAAPEPGSDQENGG